LPLPDGGRLNAYDPQALELKWQQRWAAAELFRTPTPDSRPSSYVFAGCPFTTGEAHMGHIRSYTISDAFVRFRRARGDAVLFSLGFDSFGLPAELEAIKRGLSPSAWVRKCSARMRAQFERLGYSCDWERSFISSEAGHYRWTQWLFLELLKRDLVYRRDAQVIWCDSCETVLAALQAEGDVCWRCGSAVELRQMPQWFLRVSAYVEENECALTELGDWNKAALGSQRAILGRVDGVELEATLDDGRPLTVFATTSNAVATATLVEVSPNHPEIERLAAEPSVRETLGRLRQAGRRRADRATAEVVMTAQRAAIPGRAEPIPVVISLRVDNRFGPTAVLGDGNGRTAPQRAEGDGGEIPAAGQRRAVRYRAQDFPISRQRSWGAPIPLVHCRRCGVVPVGREQLPVKLPEFLPRDGRGNALGRCESFIRCDCPNCGDPESARETETLDCHVDALWMWLPICVPPDDRSAAMFDHPEMERWLPVRQIVWGSDAGGYIFDQRITARILQDAGKLVTLPRREPFRAALMHQMVRMDGRKMSKHLGNVVDPSRLVVEVGADTVRLAVLAAAAPAKPFDWNEQPLARAEVFLRDLWTYAEPRLREWPRPDAGSAEPPDRPRLQLGRWCEAALAKTTAAYERLEMQRAASNSALLLERIEQFERRAVQRGGELSSADRKAIVGALSTLLQLIAPLTPHIAEELWEAAGNEAMISATPWPEGTRR
jgi:leucyl-tRNA synthetase